MIDKKLYQRKNLSYKVMYLYVYMMEKWKLFFLVSFLICLFFFLPKSEVYPGRRFSLSMLSNKFFSRLSSSCEEGTHFFPRTPTNFPRNSQRGFFLPRLPKCQKGDLFSKFWGTLSSLSLIGPVPFIKKTTKKKHEFPHFTDVFYINNKNNIITLIII